MLQNFLILLSCLYFIATASNPIADSSTATAQTLTLVENVDARPQPNFPLNVKALVVIAHPDDEGMVASTVYSMTQRLNAEVDLLVITNGENSFKSTALAEKYYGIDLQNEDVRRKKLPQIRKDELRSAARVIGVNELFFLDEKDVKYTRDAQEVLNEHWDIYRIKKELTRVLHQKNYDFVFTMLPLPNSHGQQKVATLLTLDVTAQMPLDQRPMVLGFWSFSKHSIQNVSYTQLSRFFLTRSAKTSPAYIFDKTQRIVPHQKANYKVITNWLIAEHKSQGNLQLNVNKGDYECFWSFSTNDPKDVPKGNKLFEALNPHNPDLAKGLLRTFDVSLEKHEPDSVTAN